ncbi:serine/threonine protein kinase [Nocardioides eburneiflavus]|uniref:non-specific serine/threonine protein kinase n=1 Tax=Nocardioides eburneiflavus TaxID=2518372 RepID=A0A4Z1CGX0_9ACTN|nr:serine/threonine-protein kinase [Nocardioides eburneiflavus]TGN65238.1 serine/threonine protein kinase [Nocardioides eburneiflavus]
MIAGRYRLEREIGRGGAGVVHLAHDELLDRRVAVKRIGLLPGTTDDDVLRAEREARLAAGISHSHVVSIFDLVKDDDCYWLVMEHVDGRTLAELVAAEGPLPAQRAAAILAQAADALVQAGRAGIVHRDVKPSNIIITADDHAKLGDFGIARTSGDTALTQTGMVTGSPAYLAPEVASGEPATEASDVWSLGATLFHAAAGRAPYDVGQNVLGGLYRIVNGDPPRLPADDPVSGLLAVMMVKDPARRWPVARVRDDLRRIARGEPSTAPATYDSSNHDAAPTAVLAADTGAASTADEPGPATRTTAAPVVPRGAPAEEAPSPPLAPSGSRRLPVGAVAAVLALVLLLGLGAWLLRPDDESPGPSGGTAEPTRSDSQEPSEEPSEEPTEEPSEEPATDPDPSDGPGATPAAMRTFVDDYFAQVTSDPETTFSMLTPEFQAASGGFEGYQGFWSTIESATPRDIRADPRSLTATYTIEFVTTSGRTTTEQGRLQLARQGDGFLIAGEG